MSSDIEKLGKQLEGGSARPEERERAAVSYGKPGIGQKQDDVEALATQFREAGDKAHAEAREAATVAEREHVSRAFLKEAGIEPQSEEDEIVADALLVAALRGKGFSNEEIDAADGATLQRLFKAESADAYRRAPLDQAVGRLKKHGQVEDLAAVFTEAQKRR